MLPERDPSRIGGQSWEDIGWDPKTEQWIGYTRDGKVFMMSEDAAQYIRSKLPRLRGGPRTEG